MPSPRTARLPELAVEAPEPCNVSMGKSCPPPCLLPSFLTALQSLPALLALCQGQEERTPKWSWQG